jgi:uncharacterized protein YceK
MRFLVSVMVVLCLGGCTAMMVGGGSGKSYPPAKDCPAGQVRTENGCEA